MNKQPNPVPIKQVQITNSYVNLLLSKPVFHPEIIDSKKESVLIRMDDQGIPMELLDRVECEIMTAGDKVRRGFASDVHREGRYLYMTCQWKDPDK